MCVVSNQIKFCTCTVGSIENLKHYWLLYRFNKKKELHCLGEPIMPYHLLQPNFVINKETLANRLNQPDAFDKVMRFKEKDQLEIVINNLLEDTERMVFCFRYKNGKWIDEEYDPFELMNNFDELEWGNLKELT